jgi:hypothetical protein
LIIDHFVELAARRLADFTWDAARLTRADAAFAEGAGVPAGAAQSPVVS